MATGLFLLVGGVVVGLFATVFGVLNFSLPNPIFDAIHLFFSLVHILGGFLPFIADLIAIWIVLVPNYVTRYVIGVIFWIWARVPWIGSQTEIVNWPGGHSVSYDKSQSRSLLKKRTDRIRVTNRYQDKN